MDRPSAVRWGNVAGLLLWLVATSALAGKVVVLDLRGDLHGRLRTQLERALQHTGGVELVPLATYQRAAAKAHLRGARAMTPAALKRLSGALDLSLAITGTMKRRFAVRFLDPTGRELWSKTLPLSRGRLSPVNAQRLARAAAAAVRPASAVQPPAPLPRKPVPEEQARPPVASAPASVRAPSPPEGEPRPDLTPKSLPPSSPSGTSGGTSTGGPGTEAPSGHLEPAPKVTAPWASLPASRTGQPSTPAEAAEPEAISSTSPVGTASDGEAAAEESGLPSPPLVRVLLLGSATYRSYCARPGVSRCSEFDALDAGARQPGPTVDFSAQVPYGGFDLGLELFPFARLSSAARGLGLLGEYHRGFELTQVHQESGAGPTPDTQASADDVGFQAAAVLRWYFAHGDPARVGFLGGRAGYFSRAFEVAPSVSAILPGAHHRGPIVAVDFAYPFARWLRAELSAELYPRLFTGSTETVGFGSTGRGLGYGFQIGPAGALWGPLGYSLHLRCLRVTDTFEGQGVSWQAGGVTQATYLSLQGGLTLTL